MRLAVLVVALVMADPEHAPRNGAARRRLRLKQVGHPSPLRSHPIHLHSSTFVPPPPCSSILECVGC